MAPRQRTDPDVQEEIEKLVLRGWGASQIHNHLGKDPKFSGRLPHVRQTQRTVQRLTPADDSGTWTLMDSEPEHVGAVLEVLAAAVMRSGGQKTRFTKAEARWVIAVRTAAPDLPAREVYPIARRYLLREADEADVTGSPDLDALLAYAPWRGWGAQARYQEAVLTRQIPYAPVWWANADDYRSLLHDMGFLDWLIDESEGDYQRLLKLTRRLETFGTTEEGRD